MSSQLLFSLVLVQVIALGALGQLCTKCPNIEDRQFTNLNMTFNNSVNSDGCKVVTVTCVLPEPACTTMVLIRTADYQESLAGDHVQGTFAFPTEIVCGELSPTTAGYMYKGKHVIFECNVSCPFGAGYGSSSAVTIEVPTEHPTTEMPVDSGCKVQK
ncbi:hypothetical protein GCK72_021585 [Caenorhabditis remanei]|uniref:Uncharacterized protein n=1 Tax=Caenorhabditis remanei TaxID=31234 RepID=A0A6A5GIK1_CAERE|nr:hypothetical protein GCK72_021585 [Caenorhabditis remanei]KAF1755018.1 hypothetical protein GCK72_021585 [Caenorhabditis remanei]